MSTSFADLSSVDSGGEALAGGYDPGVLDYSSSLDDLTDTPNSGSAILLDPSNSSSDVSIADRPTGYDSMSLSGIADAPPDPLADLSLDNLSDAQIGGANGSGTADSTGLHPASITSADDTSIFLSGTNKFGTMIGALLGKGAASTAPVVRGQLANVNPNRPAPSAPVPFNLALVLVLAVAALVWVISIGGE